MKYQIQIKGFAIEKSFHFYLLHSLCRLQVPQNREWQLAGSSNKIKSQNNNSSPSDPAALALINNL